MNEIIKDQDLKIIGKQIAESIPSLAELSDEQLKQVASWYLQRKLTDDMESLVKSSSIDLNLARMNYLELFDSIHTKKAYLDSLKRFEVFCQKKNKDYFSMTPALADEWILSERQKNRASASVRKDISAVSSFYTFLERQYDIKNIFRGTKARPKNKPNKELQIPGDKEVKIIIDELPKELSLIVQLISLLGFRAGAFENLSVHGNVLTTVSKGKDVRLTVSDDVIRFFNENKITRKEPFKQWKIVSSLVRNLT